MKLYDIKNDIQTHDTASEVDFSLRATIVSMIGYILDTASVDADKKGFGVKKLNSDNDNRRQ